MGKMGLPAMGSTLALLAEHRGRSVSLRRKLPWHCAFPHQIQRKRVGHVALPEIFAGSKHELA